MKKVFVCSPYAGDTEMNIINAQAYCRLELMLGNAPFASHLLYPQFVNDDIPEQRASGIAAGIEFMKTCDEFHIYGDIISKGMSQEIAAWRALGRTPLKCSYATVFKAVEYTQE